MTDTAPTNLFLGRSDTILGICEGLGNDFGFNPNWLRAALGLALLFQPVLVLASYLGLGVVVAVSRLIFPAARAIVPGAAAPVATADNDMETRELALAA